MTSSSISVPTTDPAELATDEIADRHFQGVKVHGGGEGIANELDVDSAGRLASARRDLGAFNSSHDRPGGTAYAAGDIYGDPAHSVDLVAATYQIRKVTVIDTAGAPIPDGMKIYFLPHSTTLELAYGADNEPFAPVDAGALYLVIVDPTPVDFGTGSFALFEPAVDTFLPAWPVKADGSLDDPAETLTLSTYLVAPDGAADTPGSILVSVYVEQVGPLPSTTIFNA